MRTLPCARLLVRSLTHTLHLPPAHAEIYHGPHVDWLKEVLFRLPQLQSLVVRGLPFFDYASLNALRFAPLDVHGPIPILGQQLRLLDVSRCDNVTAMSLSQALGQFPSLLYLDLSFTRPAKDLKVLKTLRYMNSMKVLKLKGLSLKDEDVAVLASAIGTRVRSLDLRANQLTDQSVRILLDHCFKLPIEDWSINSARDNSPLLVENLGAEMLAIYRGKQFEPYLRGAFTKGFVSRLAIEDASDDRTGLTHLHISDNCLTVESVSGLLQPGRLHVLDVGGLKPQAMNPCSRNKQNNELGSMHLSGAEKLPVILAKVAGQALTFLRIDHRLMTYKASATDEIISGCTELTNTDTSLVSQQPAELPGNEIGEISTETIPCSEFPGDSTIFVVTPVIGEAPQPTDEGKKNLVEARGGRPRTYSAIAAERQSYVRAQLAQSKGLHPGMLPLLTTLVLTDVPPFATLPAAANRIIALIEYCAEETMLARMQAQLDYTAPPGRRGAASSIKHSALQIFALREIVLEVARVDAIQPKGPKSAWRSTKSITQDADSEQLWNASEMDFSFFSEHDDEFPRPSPSGSAPLSAMAGLKIADSAYDTFPSSSAKTGLNNVPAPAWFDVIARIAEFRKAKKSAHQAQIARGETEPYVAGYWDGNIKVVRL